MLIIMPRGMRGRRGYAKRRDKNEPSIVAGLRRRGILVQALEPPVPDLLVGHSGNLFLLEVKDPAQDKAGGRQRTAGGLTPSQVDWHKKWQGYPVHVVRSLDEALKAIGWESN